MATTDGKQFMCINRAVGRLFTENAEKEGHILKHFQRNTV